ncbi:MAG: hypothetical protein A2075_05585 [Geobacteraceae bacterium GWC2_58_44]|nr:MAG: hypothetical protein A2075_05585 [Geobacteraceae bacterium GWC2_58_44]
MRKISYSCEVHAALDTVWKLLIEKVEQPQSYMPGVVQSRILQHYGNGVLREIKGEGMLIKEKVVIDKAHGEIHYFLLEHPLFTGRVVNRVVASSVQSPVAPQLLTIEVDWIPKDEQAEQLIQSAIPDQIQSEVLTLKQRAEAMEREESLPLATPYAFGMTLALPFAEAVSRVQEELLKEGFGIISEIDMKQKFRDKLHKEFRNYLILGVCNPGLAYQAFGIELNIGTLLPCNVAVYSISDARTVVMIMDPVAALSLVGNEQLTELAETVKQSMQRVLASL